MLLSFQISLVLGATINEPIERKIVYLLKLVCITQCIFAPQTLFFLPKQPKNKEEN